MTRAILNRAEELVRRTRTRVTRARVEVLATLLAATHALTRHEVEQRVRHGLAIDRVTIYRVLEWLTANGLAHRISGDDRIWRFNAAADEHAQRHAHFQCNHCGEVICLDRRMAVRAIPLPTGFRSQEVELTVKGLCADCVPAAARRRTQSPAHHRH